MVNEVFLRLSMKYDQAIFEYLTLSVRFFVRLQNVYLRSVYRLTIFKGIFAGKYLARLHREMHIDVNLFIGRSKYSANFGLRDELSVSKKLR